MAAYTEDELRELGLLPPEEQVDTERLVRCRNQRPTSFESEDAIRAVIDAAQKQLWGHA